MKERPSREESKASLAVDKKKQLRFGRSVCPKDCVADIDLAEQNKIGEQILSQLEKLPKGNRISDIRYKINETIRKSPQVKYYFFPSRDMKSLLSPISTFESEVVSPTRAKDETTEKAFKIKK